MKREYSFVYAQLKIYGEIPVPRKMLKMAAYLNSKISLNLYDHDQVLQHLKGYAQKSTWDPKQFIEQGQETAASIIRVRAYRLNAIVKDGSKSSRLNQFLDLTLDGTPPNYESFCAKLRQHLTALGPWVREGITQLLTDIKVPMTSHLMELLTDAKTMRVNGEKTDALMTLSEKHENSKIQHFAQLLPIYKDHIRRCCVACPPHQIEAQLVVKLEEDFHSNFKDRGPMLEAFLYSYIMFSLDNSHFSDLFNVISKNWHLCADSEIDEPKFKTLSILKNVSKD